MKKHLGKIHVISSAGPHDRTTALGMALQALGHGYRVFILHFLNDAAHRGEFKLQERLEPDLEVVHFATPGETRFHDPTPDELTYAAEALDYTRRVFSRNVRPDLIILDDVNPVVHHGLIRSSEFLDFLDNKPQNIEMILTGAPVHPEILRRADIVTQVTSLKEEGGEREGVHF